MKKYISTAAVLLTATTFFASCKKDNSPAPSANKSKKLVRLDDDSQPGNPVNFTYDAQGRLINTEDSADKTTLTYNGSTVNFVDFLKTENRNYRVGTFTLNGNGQAATYNYTQYDTPISSFTRNYTFEYDVNGHLIKTLTQFSGGSTTETDLDYTNENYTSITYKTNGLMNCTWKYTYSSDEDRTGLFLPFPVYANTIGGKLNKNLVVKSEQYNPSNIKTFEIQYENTLDADGYLVKQVMHYITTNKTFSYTYTYDK